MDDREMIPSELRSTEQKPFTVSRGSSPATHNLRTGAPARDAQPRKSTAEPMQVKIVLDVAPAATQPDGTTITPSNPTPPAPIENQKLESTSTSPHPSPQRGEEYPIPSRMLNEFVYCQRLFYYEFVEGVFVESADTLRGQAIHRRVDSGSGALPKAAKENTGATPVPADATPGGLSPVKQSDKPQASGGTPDAARETRALPEPETIHSRSVQMGSDRLGVVAKMDLVEVRAARAAADKAEADLFSALEVCPVDYKAGAPREGADANELWDTDKMQLGLQALILRDNGYACNEGVIYYRATKQRVRLPITPELENWIRQNIAEARRIVTGLIPPPLVNSPKCVRCSLAPVCLPDETRMLAETPVPSDPAPGPSAKPSEPPRRLMAARDDLRPLYLNTQGYRVGCKDEVLQVKEKDRVVDEARLRDVSHVALFGNIQISTQAIQSLCEMEIPVTYFSMGGWFYGITRGHTLKNVFLRMEQFRLARDEAACLALAQRFVHGKIRNHRTLLMRNHLEPPEPAILKLKRASEDALNAGSLGELLGIEGAAASLYFQNFGVMIKIADELADPAEPAPEKNAGQLAFNFNFTTRNRRPPADPVNAMLSLAYSLLSKDCTLAALAVGFDPYIGFFHQPRFGRPALALDLMEEMRPLIAESTVLSCINNRVVTEKDFALVKVQRRNCQRRINNRVVTEKDFVRAGQAVNLTAPGRKRFFQMYEQRMSSIITHPLFDYKVSYRRALELQARLLAKTLAGEIAEYVPLMTR
jgi:CRISPR-associated protein Cas1